MMRTRTTIVGTVGILGLATSVGCTLDASTPFPTGMSGRASVTAGSATSGTATPGGTADSDGGEASGSTRGTTDNNGTVGIDGTAEGTATAGEGSTEGEASTAADDASGSTTGTGTDDEGSTTGDVCTGQPLSPLLATPPLCEPTCTAIGSGVDCPGITICRLKDTETAVCETCQPCGNLHAFCTESSECDILFTCFMGQCTAMCDFNTPQTCGNPAACTNVGHPTHGVCDPNL